MDESSAGPSKTPPPINQPVRDWYRERGELGQFGFPSVDETKTTRKSLQVFEREWTYMTMYLQAKIMRRQFLYDNCHFKIICARLTIETVKETLLEKIPPPHLRLEFCNVISLVFTYTELLEYAFKIMETNKEWLPDEVIDQLLRFVPRMEECARELKTELRDFSQILIIRDEIIEYTTGYYMRLAGKDTSQLKKSEEAGIGCDRYSPYDYEWLCGSVISGPNHLTCVKYLCVSRMAQLNHCKLRNDIIAAKLGEEIDYLPHISVPLPKDEDVHNGKVLLKGLMHREISLMKLISHSNNILEGKIGKDPDLVFAKDILNMMTLRSDIMKKKRNVANCFLRGSLAKPLPYYCIIATLSMVEAHLLILHKELAFFMDKDLGMFGKAIPREVYNACFEVFKYTNDTQCNKFPLNEFIEELLENFRVKSNGLLRSWHDTLAMSCENECMTPVECDLTEKLHSVYTFKREDLPTVLSIHADLMIKNLHWEEFELVRLYSQYLQVRQGYYDWPRKSGTPELMLNTCAEPVNAFHCNFPDVMSTEIVELVTADAPSIHTRMTAESFAGYEILAHAYRITGEAKCLPDSGDLLEQYAAHFLVALGGNDVDGVTTLQLAVLFTDILEHDFEMTEYLAKYPVLKTKSVQIARQLAYNGVEIFIKAYNHHAEVQKAKLALPKKRVRSDEEDDEDDYKYHPVPQIVDIKTKIAQLAHERQNGAQTVAESSAKPSNSNAHSNSSKKSKKKKSGRRYR
ncbi:hypothetical protein CRE_00650 [Caenorhabditis remanei]|uniref:Uncharacterized protein n=1 Tax=Caenorhabditis remanei TaxID=31234 RepID=E3LDM0_CAERE|nr:hypothetical protein CRE_00650 [Caenorhabditis remanei]